MFSKCIAKKKTRLRCMVLVYYSKRRFVNTISMLYIIEFVFDVFIVCSGRAFGEVSSHKIAMFVQRSCYFSFCPKEDHDLGLKKRDTLERNLYYGIVSRARKFDVKRYFQRGTYSVHRKNNMIG